MGKEHTIFQTAEIGGNDGSPVANDDVPGDATPEPVEPPLSAEALSSGTFPRAEHLWSGLLLKDHVNTLDGDGGVGKTLLAEQLSVAIASGLPLFNHDVIQMPVLMLLCEDAYGETKFRLTEACADLGVNLSDLPIDIWCRPAEDNTIAIIQDNGAWTPGPFYRPLMEHLEKTRPGFLVLDNISDIALMDENKRPPMNTLGKKVLTGLGRGINLPLSILLNRHPSKASMADGTFYAGGTAGNNAFRHRLLLKAAEKGNGRILSVAKSNYHLTGNVNLFHNGKVFLNVMDLAERDRVDLERERVFELVQTLRADHIGVVPVQGNGHKPKDLVLLLKENYDMDITKGDVLAHLRRLEVNSRIHWVKSTPGKNGQNATYEIGPRPVVADAGK